MKNRLNPLSPEWVVERATIHSSYLYLPTEKHTESNLPTPMAFLDYEKDVHTVIENTFWKVMTDKRF
jgi:hypothetical protein